jgi:two-component system nitrogen regulation sensor histidine kinase NtrY
MGSGKFRIQIIARVLLLMLFITALVYVVITTRWVFTAIVLGAATFAAVVELISYVERANKEFTLFLLSIKNSDFSAFNTRDKRGRSFADLRGAFNTIATEFQRVRIDREANYQYLQTMVEHMDTAILSFDEKGVVHLMNEAAKQLLRNPFLHNIRSLEAVYPQLHHQLVNLTQGKNTVIKAALNGEEQLQLSMRATELIMLGHTHKLVSIQNIKNELEHNQSQAWEQLIHVLTHEIMNSITPISSLSSTLKKKSDELLKHKQGNTQTMDDLAQGLNVIEKRSIGLMNFVNDYRSLTHIPAPHLKEVNLDDLFQNIKQLKATQLEAKGIQLRVSTTGQMMINCDTHLIEQVLINLINNAEDALINNPVPVIELSAETQHNKTIIRIKDNGMGMPTETQEKIFVPFFTTKQTGSGIGLSLSRQIMLMHEGSISVSSTPGNGSVFTLIFQALLPMAGVS